MAFALKGTGSASTANSTTANQASLVVTTATTAGSAGDLAVLLYAVDNNQTTDGDEVAVTAVTDSGGNKWTKAVEFTNGQNPAQAGAVCGIWYSNLTAAIATGGTVTLTFSNATSRDASAASLTYYTKAANFYASLAGIGTLADDAAAAGSLNVTTPDIACLRVRGIASESNVVTALTPTASFAIVTQSVAVIAAATSMGIRGEWIINTGTGTASAPTAGAGAVDNASVYVAFSETPFWIPPPLSEPRMMARVNRGVAVSKIASGLFSPVVQPRAPDIEYLSLSEPVRRIRTAQKAQLFPFTAARVESIGPDSWYSPLTQPTRCPKATALIAGGLFAPVFVDTPVVVVDMDWLTPLSNPVRRVVNTALLVDDGLLNVPFVPAVSIDWLNDLSLPLRAKQRAIADYAFAPLAISEVVTIDKWFNPLAPPQNAKLGLNAALQVAYTTEYFPDTVNANAGQWFGPLAEPTRAKSSFSALYQAYTTEYYPDTFTQWLNPLSEPIRIKRGLNALDQSWVPFVTTETVTVDKWFDAFSEPVRVRSRFSATQQTYTSGYVAFEVVTIDKWFDPLSEPVRTKPALRAALQPVSTQDTVFIPNPSRYMEGWFGSLAEPLRQKTGLGTAQQSPGPLTTTEVVTVDKWYAALSLPVRQKPGLITALQSTYTSGYLSFEIVSVDKWYGALSEPKRSRPALQASLQTIGSPSFEVISVDKWFDALSEPVRTRPALLAALQPVSTQDTVFIPSPSQYMEGWYGWLAEPVRQKAGLAAAQQPTTVWTLTTAEVVTVDKWFEQLSDPTRRKPEARDRYKGENEWTAIAASMKWFSPLTEPIKLKIGLPANQQQTLAYAVTFTAEVVTVDKWFKSYADPVRAKHPADDRYAGENNWEAIAASMEWFAPFTEPVRFKPGLVPATRPPFFAAPAAIIIPSLASWWRPLAEPPKAKVSLGTHLQRTFTQDPKLFPNPARFLEGWYNWWSEPVRKLRQLNVALQQFYTASDRRPVLATITVTMAATEINDDAALFAVKVLPYNPPASAVVSLVEIGHDGSLTSIVEEGDDGSGTSIVES